MRNTLICNKPFCHKDHRTVPFSITTKIPVKEKEGLGCVYTKPGEKFWFPVRQKAGFSEILYFWGRKKPLCWCLPSHQGKMAPSRMREVLILAGCSRKGWWSGWALVLSWRASASCALHSFMCHMASGGVWLGFLMDNCSLMLNFYSPRNTKVLKLHCCSRY